MDKLKYLLSSPIGACAFCTFVFVWIFLLLFILFYIIRFHEHNASEQRFLQYVIIGLLFNLPVFLLAISVAYFVDGLHWFYWQWGAGLFIASLLMVAIAIIGWYLAKAKGDPMRYLP